MNFLQLQFYSWIELYNTLFQNHFPWNLISKISKLTAMLKMSLVGPRSQSDHFRFIKVEPAIQRSSWEKVFWKYAANLKENTRVELQFQKSCKANLLKSYFGMSVLL